MTASNVDLSAPCEHAAHIKIHHVRRPAAGCEDCLNIGGEWEILFEQGEASTRFFVILEGSVEVVHPYDAGEHLITVHAPGSFTGEFTVLAGTRSLVRGRARTPGRAE